MKRRTGVMAAAAVLCMLILSGCASKQAEKEPAETGTYVEDERDASIGGENEAPSEGESKEAGTEESESGDGTSSDPADGDGNAVAGAEDSDRKDGSDGAENGAVQNTDATPFGMHGALHVDGSVLKDSRGNIVALRGVSTHGLSWYPEYANADAFQTMRDEWGVQAIRLAMYTAEYNGYCTGDENNRSILKQRIYDCVQAAYGLGLYVIVDWHILSDNNPLTYQEEAAAFFAECTEQLKEYKNVIYEICNEPNGAASWQDIKSYAEKVIPVIRQNAPDAVIIIGTPTWSQEVDQAAADPVTGYDNLMYALHFYADTHRDDLRNKLRNAVESGLPVFVSEFGICDASGAGAVNAEQARLWMELLEQYHISSCIWNLSNKNETSALIRSDCAALSGWTYGELSASGQWFVDWMREHSYVSGEGGTQTGPGQESGEAQNGNPSQGSGEAQNGVPSQGSGESAGADGGSLTAVAEDGKLLATAVVTNSWEADGNYFYQCSLKLENQGNQNVNGWSCEIGTDQEMELSQFWCGSFSAEGSAIRITPETYNGVIGAGDACENVGFIFCTSGKISSLRVQVSAG